MIMEFGMRIADFKKSTCQAGQLCALALPLLLILAGCAEKGPVLLTIGYQAPAERAGTASTISVGISPLRDKRGEPPSVLGKRTIPSGMQSDYVVKGTVAETATAILKEAFTARGIAVKDIANWDLTADGMNDAGADLMLGGEIKTLWLESKPSSMLTQLKASVQIKLTVGSRLEKKILRTIDVNSKLDQEVLYSQEQLESALAEALSSAVNQIFQDDEVKKRIQ
jgi:uncharacterized lipoprotein YajG